MVLQSERQLRMVNKIPPQRRICQVDATGSLVKIEKHQRDFKRILNYVMLLKDIGDSSMPGTNVTEMATSRHDTYSISEMFNLFIYNYKKIFPSDGLIFRLLISDFSWATMHAALSSFNMEDMTTYSTRVFKLSKHEVSHDHPSKLWLVSCTAHTMHRFCKALNKKVQFTEKELRLFGNHLNPSLFKGYKTHVLLIFINLFKQYTAFHSYLIVKAWMCAP